MSYFNIDLLHGTYYSSAHFFLFSPQNTFVVLKYVLNIINERNRFLLSNVDIDINIGYLLLLLFSD
jgi:hypothetical protein